MKGYINITIKEPEHFDIKIPEGAEGVGIELDIALEDQDFRTRAELIRAITDQALHMGSAERLMIAGMLMGAIPWPGLQVVAQGTSAQLSQDIAEIIANIKKGHENRES